MLKKLPDFIQKIVDKIFNNNYSLFSFKHDYDPKELEEREKEKRLYMNNQNVSQTTINVKPEVKDDNTNYGYRKILVVDDNKLNIKVACRALKDFNFAIDECYDGKECLDKINQGNTYDLILMDIMMPNMNGEQTIAE